MEWIVEVWAWVRDAPAPLFTKDGASVAKDLLTAGAAIFAAATGWRALSRWKAETIGKRRVEVAESTLVAFYQMQEIIKAIRAPLILPSEMEPEEGVPEEVTRSGYYAALKRIESYKENYSDFRTKRYIFSALFGRGNMQPWDEINKIFNEMYGAADTLIRGRNDRTQPGDGTFELYRDLRRVIARIDDEDKIDARVEKAITSIEAICRPAIEASFR